MEELLQRFLTRLAETAAEPPADDLSELFPDLPQRDAPAAPSAADSARFPQIVPGGPFAARGAAQTLDASAASSGEQRGTGAEPGANGAGDGLPRTPRQPVDDPAPSATQMRSIGPDSRASGAAVIVDDVLVQTPANPDPTARLAASAKAEAEQLERLVDVLDESRRRRHDAFDQLVRSAQERAATMRALF